MSELLGKQIRNFRVVDLLGKGGMGEVYVAYDEKLERRVALKSIRAEQKMNATAKTRFLREARVLSQLAHPNICQIFDYIEGDEADLLVLELIKGRTLTAAIREGLDDRTKLRIAEQLAGVLAAAHERNIVHRDLKPDNVMLTEDGQVKVLDFGLSRAMIDEDTLVLDDVDSNAPTAELVEGVSGVDDDTMRLSPGSDVASGSGSVTAIGAIMGTLGYMSPEQASGEVATAASDMYSFGLMLQELFTGKRPFETGLSPHEMVRRSQKGESLPVEGVDADVTALINRLKSRAIGARPSAVDTLERIRWIMAKPRRRRRQTLLAASIVVLTLFGIFMTIQTVRATRAERAAAREAEVARNVTEFLVDLFDVSDPYVETSGETVTARELLDKGAARIESDLKDQPEVQARMMLTMGSVYRKLGLFEQAQPQLERALTVTEETHASDHTDVGDGLFELASLYSDQGKYDEAEPLFRRSLEIREKALGPDDPHVADVLNNMAALLARQGKLEEAQPILERSLSIREKAFGPDAPIVADGLNNLALLNSFLGNVADAETMYKRSLAIRERAFGPDHPRVGDSLNNLAVDYFENERLADAEPLAERALAIFEKALGPDHPHVAHTLNNLGEIQFLQGKVAESGPLFERSLAIYETSSGADHPDVAYELTWLGKVYVNDGRLVEAESALKRALRIYESAVGLDHPDTAHTLFNLGCLEAKKGNRDKAIEYLSSAFPAGTGMFWAEAMEDEPALASLKGDAEFERIVETAKESG